MLVFIVHAVGKMLL